MYDRSNLPEGMEMSPPDALNPPKSGNTYLEYGLMAAGSARTLLIIYAAVILYSLGVIAWYVSK